MERSMMETEDKLSKLYQLYNKRKNIRDKKKSKKIKND